MAGASKPGNVSTQQQRIANLAEQAPEMGFTSLNHYIDLRWLYEAYQQTRGDGAVGVDGQTAKEYTANLRENLQSLLDRAKSGTYWAPPVLRVYIPKGTSGDTRPIGIPTFEDKILQRAVVMVLQPIYEHDFLDCSYGFRPGRSAHQALEALWQQTMQMGGGWILEVDIQKFFDKLDHAQLRDLLKRRVRDGVVLQLIGKWLNAGVLEEGKWRCPETGTPQGGVISPLLANIYLHYVLDEWFAEEVQPRLQGRSFLIRYADDFVMGFACEADARRVWDVLAKRLAKYGLTIHPEKTRLVPFQRPPEESGDSIGAPSPGTFDFLGFTHYWGRSRKGNAVVKRKTARSRYRRTLGAIADWCQSNMHREVPEQHAKLSQKLHGHYGYFGITGNYRCLANLFYQVTRTWRKWLGRRSWQAYFSWPRFRSLWGQYPLPAPRVVHSVNRGTAKL